MDDAIALLHSGREAMPSSTLISFHLAELEETRKSDYSTNIVPIFDTLIADLEKEIVATDVKFDAERDRLRATLNPTAGGAGKGCDSNGGDADSINDGGADASAGWDGEARERERERIKEVEKEIELKVEAKRKRAQAQHKGALTLSFIVYMQAARRHVNGIWLRGVISNF